MIFEVENTNAAIISIKNPNNFSVSYKTNINDKEFGELIAEISAEEFDKIAVAWCKHRKLISSLGGRIGKEYGSPECEYD